MYSRAEELIRKGKMPKGYGDLNPFPWACRQQRHDCHQARWRAIEVYRKVYFETAHPAVSFIYAKHYQTNANI